MYKYNQWKEAEEYSSKASWSGEILFTCICILMLVPGFVIPEKGLDGLIGICCGALLARLLFTLESRWSEKLSSETLEKLAKYPLCSESQTLLKKAVCSQKVLRMWHLIEILCIEKKAQKKDKEKADKERKQRAVNDLHQQLCQPVNNVEK